MKSRLSLYLFSLVLVTLFAPALKAQDMEYTYPTYQEVFNRFSRDYALPEMENGGEFRLEKRPDGWHAVLWDHPKGEAAKDDKYWDRITGKWSSLSFPTEGEAPQHAHKFLARRYNICPYFGYPGWPEDVIQDYGVTLDHPDSVLYGMGLAWGFHATNLLSGRSGYGKEETKFELKEGKNALNKDQLAEFNKCLQNEVKLMDAAYAKNPLMETMVGSLRTKISTEYVAAYLDLLIYQNEKEARKVLKPGLFDPFYLSWARNMLNSCEKDAVLFTFGDTDTYTLLYVQAMEDFRTDVSVVNTSLLNMPRYVELVRRGTKTLPPLEFSISPEQVASRRSEVVMVPQVSDEKEFKKELGDLGRQLEEPFREGKYVNLGSNRYFFRSDRGLLPFDLEKPYLLRGELMILDFISQNNWERPVYFANTGPESGKIGLNTYLHQEGLASRLDPAEGAQQRFIGRGFVSIDIMKKRVMEEFQWQEKEGILNADLNIVAGARLTYIELAQALREAGRCEEATQVLNQVMETFPDRWVPMGSEIYFVAEGYYGCKQTRFGDATIKSILSRLETGSGSLSAPNYAKAADLNREMYRSLLDLASNYERESLVGEIEKSMSGSRNRGEE